MKEERKEGRRDEGKKEGKKEVSPVFLSGKLIHHLRVWSFLRGAARHFLSPLTAEVLLLPD